jgi:hypothetical protein
VIQTSRSTSRLCHSESAKLAASWVLPHDASQSRDPLPTGRAGTRATAVPGRSAAPRLGAVSSRAVKPSAAAGITPDWTGHPASSARGGSGIGGGGCADVPAGTPLCIVYNRPSG